MIFLLAGLLVLASLFLIGKCGLQLAQNNANDLRVICYFFSLTSVLTIVISFWGINTGAIDSYGNFHGDFGALLKNLLDVMLDLSSSIKIFSAILFIVVAPQLLSYFLSGLFGCASNFFLIRRSFSFYVWSLVKSFAAVAGILFPLGIIGYYYSWKNFDNNGVFSLLFIALVSLMAAFSLLSIFREGEEISDSVRAILPNSLRKAFTTIHNKATRNCSR